MQDLRKRTLAAFLEFLTAMLDPGIEDILEGVFAGQLGRMPTLIAFDLGIDSPGEQGLGLVPLGTGLAQAEGGIARSEEHTSELQSLMRSSYAVFCLKQKKTATIQRD